MTQAIAPLQNPDHMILEITVQDPGTYPLLFSLFTTSSCGRMVSGKISREQSLQVQNMN